VSPENPNTSVLSVREIEESKSITPFDQSSFSDEVAHLLEPTLGQFDRLVKSYVFFNAAFVVLGVVELILITLFFSFLAQSSMLAISLAVPFLSAFSYFIVRLYFQAKKPEQLIELRDQYLQSCRERLGYQEGIADHHMALASASCRFAAILHNREYSYYRPPTWLEIFSSTLEKFSCWCHWQDLHQIKELLLHHSIEEHIKLVKCEPTNLEVHAALANAYVMLSSLYSDPRKTEGHDDDHWIPPQRYSPDMQHRFRQTASRAIEEFKILGDYAPNDPWVHAQLAYSYHDLQMPEEEIHEYETILQLQPDDRETLFKLGMLYFQQGKNAQGLRIYEELKCTNYKKAESLIKFYGAYTPDEDHDCPRNQHL